jgi:hypothetical protein
MDHRVVVRRRSRASVEGFQGTSVHEDVRSGERPVWEDGRRSPVTVLMYRGIRAALPW